MFFTRETHPSQVHMLNAHDGEALLSVVEFTYETLHSSVAVIIPVHTNDAITLHEVPQDFFDSINALTENNKLPCSAGTPFLQQSVDIRIIENPNLLGIKCADIYVNPATLENLLDEYGINYKYIIIKLPKGKARVPPIAFSCTPFTRRNIFLTRQARENGIPLFAYFNDTLYWTASKGADAISSLVTPKNTFDVVNLPAYVIAEARFGGENFEDWLEDLPEGIGEFFTCDDELLGVHYQGMLPNGTIMARGVNTHYVNSFEEEETEEEDDDFCGDPDCESCYPLEEEEEPASVDPPEAPIFLKEENLPPVPPISSDYTLKKDWTKLLKNEVIKAPSSIGKNYSDDKIKEKYLTEYEAIFIKPSTYAKTIVKPLDPK